MSFFSSFAFFLSDFLSFAFAWGASGTFPSDFCEKSPASRKSLGKSIAGAPPSSLSSASDGVSVPASMALISSSAPSSCSGEIPNCPITLPTRLSTGTPISLAHLRQRPFVLFSPFSIFVTKITAIRLWHCEHITI